ncbi:hypothetical protein POF50_008710 [Streptomyces sp. SL13]|uniref:Uncharacterized protein n=1 Tax=Streptantibioticus silvisoli TaxID=2705255 RepID=A0AA90H377_9ACTN|nr:hypothetical protein [Streptantibioticus silvisoli]MDI5969422.1 hypothetical protein [Streptantibioticus silvisoli]
MTDSAANRGWAALQRLPRGRSLVVSLGLRLLGTLLLLAMAAGTAYDGVRNITIPSGTYTVAHCDDTVVLTDDHVRVCFGRLSNAAGVVAPRAELDGRTYPTGSRIAVLYRGTASRSTPTSRCRDGWPRETCW